jgi:hypothetical protein
MDLNETVSTVVNAQLVVLWLSVRLLSIKEAILDRPGEGIRRVERWLRGSEAACIDALGMTAVHLERLVDNPSELDLVKESRGRPASLRVAIVLYMIRKGVIY